MNGRAIFRLAVAGDAAQLWIFRLLSVRLHQTTHSYLQLGVMLVTNILFCWYPVYYWKTYAPSGDERDGIVPIFGLFIG